MNMLYQYLYIDFFLPVWPNIAASGILFLPAFWWHHSRMAKKLEANHSKLMHRLETIVGLAEDVVDEAEKKE